MTFLSRLFGLDRKEAWQRFSLEVGGQYTKGFLTSPGSIKIPHGQTFIQFDAHFEEGMQSETRVHAKYICNNNSRFNVRCQRKQSLVSKTVNNALDKCGKKLDGLLEKGCSIELEPGYVVWGNSEVQLRNILDDVNVRQQILKQPAGILWGEAGVLDFKVDGIVADLDRMKSIHQLFVVVLNQLNSLAK